MNSKDGEHDVHKEETKGGETWLAQISTSLLHVHHQTTKQDRPAKQQRTPTETTMVTTDRKKRNGINNLPRSERAK
jgi:hypothetical protein